MNEFIKYFTLLLIITGVVNADEKVSFNFEIRPILSDKCFYCHGPDNENRKAKLRLDTPEGALKALKKGRHPIVKGQPQKSEVWKRIVTTDEDDLMPPPDSNLSLSDKEKNLIKKWIEQGAEYKSHWAFEPLSNTVNVPQVKENINNPVDAFVIKKLEKNGLKMAPPALKEILLRRASFVLTGLPPTVDEVRNFMADQSPDAFEKQVDRMLQSKACAEKLAVDWMDLSRFSDTYGFQVDRSRNMTPWRDWVLRALDGNMPYDQFITWQLAGDLIPNPTKDSILATAFNRLHQQKVEGGSIEEEFRVEYVADRTHTAGTAFLGLTFECSRCHDHKYDPISMKDYYSLYAFFNNIDEAGLYSFFTSSMPTPALQLTNDGIDKKLNAQKSSVTNLEEKLSTLKESQKTEFKKWLQQTVDVKPVGALGEYSFDSENEGLKNKIPDQPHGKGHSQVFVENGKSAFLLDGDTEIRFDNLGPYKRSEPISLHLRINVPEHKDRAVIIHRSKAWTDSASRGWEVLLEDGKLSWAFIHFWPGNAIRIKTEQKLPLNKWHDVTLTYDGSSRASGLKIYLNGILQKCESVRDSLTKEIHYGKSNIPVTIGARFRDRGFKNGLIDQFNFYNRELTQAEVNILNNRTAEEKDLYEYYLSTVNEAYKNKLNELKTAREALNGTLNGIQEIMVMKELPQVRKTYVLKRGLYSMPDMKQEVVPNPPEEIYPFSKDLPRNRLGLAKWLTSPQHPLTSRVAVNRYWQMVFGEGIVTTPDDFGSQGALPAHPQLLNWLSRNFIDNGWNIKALLKTLVTSKTFMQSSIASTEKLTKDRYNKLLSFGPRRRLSAEMVRDNALSVSGLLNTHFGGNSENAGSSHRRGLYLFWKRNDPPADMLIFDAPRRQICSVKRETTATPLQALVLLNKDLYTRTAVGLANKALHTAGGKQPETLGYIFTALTGRSPDKNEAEILNNLLTDQLNYFKQNPAQTDSFLKANGSGSKWKDAPELAAWGVVTNLIMNMDSSIILR